MSKIASFRHLRAFRALFTPDRLAVVISLLGILVSYLVTDRVFERMPHIEDEVAYVWQARVIAHGQLTIPSPPHPKSYLVPFVVDFHGHRFGKYPPGWPAVLAVAIKMGLRAWLNPLLAGLGVWLTYWLGRRFFSQVVGLLAAGLMVTSPFFLMNSGSLLSHPFGLVLSAVFVLAWLELFAPAHGPPSPGGAAQGQTPLSPAPFPQMGKGKNIKILWVLLAGCSLGMMVLSRPFTATAVAIPFGLHGLFLLVRGSWPVRRRVLSIGLIVLVFIGLYLAWQKMVTGNPLENPYVLWWPYDKIGFGKGYGVLPEGHNIAQAFYNTQRSLISGASDLFGWGTLSWIFIPFGLWAVTVGRIAPVDEKAPIDENTPAGEIPVEKRRFPRMGYIHLNRQAWMLFSVAVSLVICYMAYWIGSELFGPRYYYEGLFSLTLLSGAGIAFLAGWRVNPSGGGSELEGEDNATRLPLRGWYRFRAPVISLLLAGLVAYNLALYLPGRLQQMHNLYDANRGVLRDFLNARVVPENGIEPADSAIIQPALIIVHSDSWHIYGAFLELEDPFLNSPYIFAWNTNPDTDAALQQDFPARQVYHYYEDEPGVLYLHPRE